ncbi:S1 family peptidase [Flavobacterium zepuense]|uniref:S1 family peptidase n=1 Tax=Flavobacterium zepuense TaxID=2593302 RepID=A0A552V9E7_9FLAO|nr:trypsin-like serine protease [Flavobacterium zepuense]TRW27097.1 S1 family peptidase [Flavobacterium zepuense]
MSGTLEKGIGIAIMLFILSMISERVVTWIKIYFGKQGRRLWFLFNNDKKNLREVNSKEDEKSMEVRVLGLNICISIFIAIGANANFFAIFKASDPFMAVGWENQQWDFSLNGLGFVFYTLIGCALTGLFISLGSKFWHDMLDLLFYTKNLREKLSQKQTYEASSTDELDEYLALDGSELAQLAVDQNGSYLKVKFPNINFLTDSVAIIDSQRKNVVAIYLIDSNVTNLPAHVPVKLPSGKVHQVETEIITDVGIGKPSAGLDGSVAKKSAPGYQGSACCVATDASGFTYLVTNCHVLTEGDLKSPQDETGNEDVLYNQKDTGDWSFGSMDKRGDFALVKLKNPDQFINANEPQSYGGRLKKITTADHFKEVNIAGRVTTGKGYIIENVKNDVGIMYNYGNSLKFNEAILVGNISDRKKCRPASEQGDSGGAVYDNDQNLIGIITGLIEGKFSIVIPLHQFVSDNTLNIY